MGAYLNAHRKVRRLRGPAAPHDCVGCSGPARDWAFQHPVGVVPLYDIGRPYSDDPEHYAPMCKSCHSTLDGCGPAGATALHAKAATDPALHARLQEVRAANGAKMGAANVSKANARTRECSCGVQKNPAGIGLHQKLTGHTGYRDLVEAT